jgi:hypothetical protein
MLCSINGIDYQLSLLNFLKNIGNINQKVVLNFGYIEKSKK